MTLTVEDAEGINDTDVMSVIVHEESFVDSYGLPLGIIMALVAIALLLLLILRRRKGGMAPTDMDE